jgi:carboxyl-terminal processing protease
MSTDFQVGKFNDVLSYVQKFYVDTVNAQKLVEASITAMLNQLDPHSVYLTANQSSIERSDSREFQGIGVEFEVLNDTLIVVAPVPGGPSENLGILAGDKILKINDTSCIGITQEMVPKKLRGPKGTHVKVSIYRPGEKGLIDFDITRDNISIYSVDVSYMVTGDIGTSSSTSSARRRTTNSWPPPETQDTGDEETHPRSAQ